MTEPAQLGCIEKIERLQQRRPLAPRAAAKQPDIAERGLDRLLDAGAIAGKIVSRQQAAVVHLKLDDGRSDIAAIEGIARRSEGGLASAMAHGGFLVRHE